MRSATSFHKSATSCIQCRKILMMLTMSFMTADMFGDLSKFHYFSLLFITFCQNSTESLYVLSTSYRNESLRVPA